ncbi:helix-hairpin-helix domain-containing protein [Metabacillus sp. 113a]|uniref:helix-hairpin-helix domain-containing protein n=1 Tax=Metabacillus sp. 113a TaxID=3404706 RepID=UPI003CE9C55D
MNWLHKYKIPLLGGALILLIAGFIYLNGLPQKEALPVQENMENLEPPEAQETKEPDGGLRVSPDDQRTPFIVDIKGAVKEPGVYEFWDGARVKDAVDRAGGLLETADGKQINLAGLLIDGTAVYIPAEGEDPESLPAPPGSSGAPGQTEPVIDLNKATLEDLQTLPGIGPSKAEAILSYREEKGAFKTKDELKEVSGIGDKTFEKLQDSILVN